MNEESVNEWYDFTVVSPFEELILKLEEEFRSLMSGKDIESMSMVNIDIMIELRYSGSDYELVYKNESDILEYDEENECYDGSILEILNNKHDFVNKSVISNFFGVRDYFLFHRIGSSNYSRSISSEMLKTIESGIAIAMNNTQLDIPIFITVFYFIYFIYLFII